MTKRAFFKAAFIRIPGAPLGGCFVRGIRLIYISEPLSALGSIQTGGRYNAPGAFEVHYLAPNTDVVLRETGTSGVKRIAPRAMFSIDVELAHVVDLGHSDVSTALNVSRADLLIDWRDELLKGRTPITHEIGAAARDAGVEALLVPSARVPGEMNLAVIADRLRVGSLVRINPAEGFPSSAEIEIRGRR